MKFGRLLTVVLFILSPMVASAQTPWQYRWTKGAKLDYKVQHVTQVAEVVDGKKVETKSKLNVVKRWSVTDVDAKGVGTIELSLVAMRNEQTRPGGEVILFDSQDLEKSSPALRDAMSKYVGKTLAVLRVDPMGRVVEAKEHAAKYHMEPPFIAVLPGVAPKEGQAWVRPYDIILDPPLGTGEKIPATHRFDCAKIDGKLATLKLTTDVKDMPATSRDQIPLFQKLPQGEVVFDTATGRLHSATLTIDRMVENHEGPGSSYRFRSDYTEQVME